MALYTATQSLAAAAADNPYQRFLFAAMATELHLLSVTFFNDSKGRDQSVARFCASWAQLKTRAPPAALTEFARLALQHPAADVPAFQLDCWQKKNVAISSVDKLRDVVARLRPTKAVS